MTHLALKLGLLKADGFTIVRSSVRWLRENGQMCRANQPIAYCNVTLEPTGRRVTAPSPFTEEQELQVVLAARVDGVLSMDAKTSRGGYLSIRTSDTWDPDTTIAYLDTGSKPADETEGELRHLILAGRRMTALADTRAGLLPGWHGRSRGWWSEAGEKPITLISLGVCDVTGVIQGEQCAYLEMFEARQRASQFVTIPDHPIAPCVPVLLDQLQRTPAQLQAILDDINSYFRGLDNAPSPNDWMFIGTVLSVLQYTPIKDDYSIFSAAGIQRTGAADAVLISLAVEPQSILRHRKLGYHLHVMRHYQAAAGPAVKTWLATAFEPVKRPITAIQRDYERLIDNLHRTTGGHLMVLNRMSTSGYEDISSYMGFDAPLGDTLSNIAAKEMNLMLNDVADSRDLSIIDVDAIAAHIGGAQHLPDGIHQSGLMQMALRENILQSLEDLGRSHNPVVAVR